MNSTTLASSITNAVIAPADDRRRLADRIFYIAVAVNAALTLFCLLAMFSGFGARIAGDFRFDARTLATLFFAFLFFNVFWAVVWFGVKNLLLKYFVGMSHEDRRAVFSSRMSQPFELNGLLRKYSERRIRIADMIGRRGRFITLAGAMCFIFYAQIVAGKSDNFATAFTSQSLFDQVVTNWVFLACFYVNGFVGATMYGAQTRIMDGTLARANCMSIVTLWALFKFVLIPIGAELATLYPREQFALLFALIWVTYIVVDTFRGSRRIALRHHEDPRARRRRRESEVLCRHGHRAGRRTRVQCRHRRAQRAVGRISRARRDRCALEHRARAVLAARHRRLHDGHR